MSRAIPALPFALLILACESRAHDPQDTKPIAVAGPHALLSRSVPASASSGSAGAAQDAVVAPFAPDHMWKCKGDCWLAYDLSGVPEQARSALYVVLFFGGNAQYQLNVNALGGVDMRGVPLGGYVLEGGPSRAGPWTSLVTVSSLAQASRVHRVDFRGHRVLRYRSPEATTLKMDVYAAAEGPPPSLLVAGDSIANIEMVGVPTGWFSAGVAARRPGSHPPIVGGGIAFTTATDGRDLLVQGKGNFAKGLSEPLLDLYRPVTALGLAFGTNDAAPGRDTNETAFYQAYVQIIRAALARNMTVAVATPTWAPDGNRQIGLRMLAGRIGLHPDLVPEWKAGTYRVLDHVWRAGKVYRCVTAGTSTRGPAGTGSGIADGGSARWQSVPSLRETFAAEVQRDQVVAGPDFYSLFRDHPDWLSDGLHPNAAGSTVWQKAWVDWALGRLPP
jgi:lysophospholipase L1-like esterase